MLEALWCCLEGDDGKCFKTPSQKQNRWLVHFLLDSNSPLTSPFPSLHNIITRVTWSTDVSASRCNLQGSGNAYRADTT